MISFIGENYLRSPMTTITYPVSNAQGTAQITAGGTLWINGQQYVTPTADTYPNSTAEPVYVNVPGYQLGIPGDLYVLTHNRGYVIASELATDDVLELNLSPVNGTYSDSLQFQVTYRTLLLRVLSVSASGAAMLPPYGATYVSWSPTNLGDQPPAVDSTPLDSYSVCLCLLPGAQTPCSDAEDLSDEVDWVEDV